MSVVVRNDKHIVYTHLKGKKLEHIFNAYYYMKTYKREKWLRQYGNILYYNGRGILPAGIYRTPNEFIEKFVEVNKDRLKEKTIAKWVDAFNKFFAEKITRTPIKRKHRVIPAARIFIIDEAKSIVSIRPRRKIVLGDGGIYIFSKTTWIWASYDDIIYYVVSIRNDSSIEDIVSELTRLIAENSSARETLEKIAETIDESEIKCKCQEFMKAVQVIAAMKLLAPLSR